MSESTIEWTERTWNPIVGCSILSPGCTNCYAMKMAARLETMGNVSHYAGTTKKVNGNAVWTGKIAYAPENILAEPLKRRTPTTYFVNSMGDLFHESIPDEAITQVFAIMGTAKHHTFQVLTKRAGRMRQFVTALYERRSKTVRELMASFDPIAARSKVPDFVDDPLPNVWLGVSAERQQEADERIPHLLQTPAAVRFISAEPLLGPIDLMDVIPNPIIYTAVHGMDRLLDWVIVGGESGPNARPMHPDWARALRDQCAATGTHYFFKQWGRFAPQHDGPEEAFFASIKNGEPDHLIDKGFAFGRSETQRPWFMFDLGKKAAGRLLDGKLHNAMPQRVTA